MGFLPAIQRILAVLPQQRQTLCFSATLEQSVAALVNQYMREPGADCLGSTLKPAESVELQAFEVAGMQKPDVLRQLLYQEKGRTLVFARTKRGTERLAKQLARDGFAAAMIHGDRTQAQRTAALNSFEEGRIKCWSPPIWPRAACMFRTLCTSSTTIFQLAGRFHSSRGTNGSGRCGWTRVHPGLRRRSIRVAQYRTRAQAPHHAERVCARQFVGRKGAQHATFAHHIGIARGNFCLKWGSHPTCLPARRTWNAGAAWGVAHSCGPKTPGQGSTPSRKEGMIRGFEQGSL